MTFFVGDRMRGKMGMNEAWAVDFLTARVLLALWQKKIWSFFSQLQVKYGMWVAIY